MRESFWLWMVAAMTMFLVVATDSVLTPAGPTAGPSAAKPNRGRPKIRLSPELFNFGYVPPNSKVTYRFWLANDGTDSLIVGDVKPYCGCTTVPLPRNRVAPSDSVPLDLVFDSKNITGVINKSVTVYSNDSTHNPSVIYFTARVQSPDSTVTVSPLIAEMEAIDKSAEVIRLRNHTAGEYRVHLLAPPAAYIKYEMSNDTVGPGAEMTITVRRTRGMPIGPFVTSLSIMLDGESPHPVTIPIRGVGYVE